jgi:ArsR family transcriptional regulator, arsenate/arsenite/antimonite-responsive transcriptional repressor
MYEIMAVTKAMADETRVRMLAALEGRELCVCQLIELVELAPSTVSKHLSILRGARLIESRKKGRWIYYRLAKKDSSKLIMDSLSWLAQSLRTQKRIMNDQKRLEQILKTDPEQLCRKQTMNSEDKISDQTEEVTCIKKKINIGKGVSYEC